MASEPGLAPWEHLPGWPLGPRARLALSIPRHPRCAAGPCACAPATLAAEEWQPQTRSPTFVGGEKPAWVALPHLCPTWEENRHASVFH